MRIVTVNGKPVRVPSTRADWELYDMAGAEAAVFDLNSQVDTLVGQWTTACRDGEMAPTQRGIDSAWRRLFEPGLKRHATVGAMDTEPRSNADHVLRLIAGAFRSV